MWKTVLVGSDAVLTVETGWLCVSRPDKLTRIPIGDVYSVVIDDPRCRISAASMNALTQNGAHIILCDEKHLPATLVLPLARHYRGDAVLKEQIALPENVRDELWAAVVRAKIRNQITALKLCGVPAERWEDIHRYADGVLPGDKRNAEATVARKYFRALFGSVFRRTDEDVTNAALNYGYAIMRSAMAKSLTAYGLNCALGIHHIGEGNAFHLADDLMEPLRPLVDYWTDSHIDELFDTLTASNRRNLIDLVNRTVLFDGKRMRVRYAIDLYASSFAGAIREQKAERMKFPELLSLDILPEDEGE